MTKVADAREAGLRQGKSAAAFRTISEVATELDMPAHVLRFWESKFTHVKPLKRGGGRRYYRPEDVALLRGIRELLYTDGYTIKGVQKLLREGGAKQVSTDRSGEPEIPPVVENAAPHKRAHSADSINPSGVGAVDREVLREVLNELEGVRVSLKNVGI